jgi:phospholipid/cholesterol/gamma-HCH transport system permease protein
VLPLLAGLLGLGAVAYGLARLGGVRPLAGLATAVEGLGRWAHFAWSAMRSLPAALLRPRELATQGHQVLLGSLPLGVTAGVVIGAVVWLQLRGALARYPGAKEYLPQALALAVVLEFAPIGAGLIVAGRSGAGLAAELGSMKLTEQMDALEVMGLSPLRELVAPRVLACVLGLPLLTAFVAWLALAAGAAAEAAAPDGLTVAVFAAKCRDALALMLWPDVALSVLKTAVFGALVGVSGCYHGMSAQGGTEGVGRAATAGVVTSIFLVLVADVALVRAIKLLG